MKVNVNPDRLLVIVVAFFVVHCGREPVDFRQGVARSDQPIVGEAAVAGSATSGLGGYGGRAISWSDAGRDAVAGMAGTVAKRSSHPTISEIKIDPPGADGDFEFVELSGEPGTLLTGVYLIALEGDAESNLGEVDTVIDLSKCGSSSCQFDENGHLLVAADGALFTLAEGTAVRESKELSRGGLENGAASLLLVSCDGPPRAGEDWDANDDGQLELPRDSTLVDAVSWSDGDADDRNYGGVVLGPKPKPHAAWSCGDGLGKRIWCFGQLTGGSGSMELDASHTSPLGLVAPRLTPDDRNDCDWLSSGGSSSGNAGSAGNAGDTTAPSSVVTFAAGGLTGTTRANNSSVGGAIVVATDYPGSEGVLPRPIEVGVNGGSAATATSMASAVPMGGRLPTLPQPFGGAPVIIPNSSALQPAESGGHLIGAGTAGTPLIVHGPAAAMSGGGSTWWTSSPVFTDDTRVATTTAGARPRLNSGTDAQSVGRARPEVPGGCSITSRRRSPCAGTLALMLAICAGLELRKLTSRLTRRQDRSRGIGVLDSSGVTALAPESPFRYTRLRKMSNRAIWNVRRRHEWLTKPIKGKRLKKRSRTRIGLQAAIDRRAAPPPVEA